MVALIALWLLFAQRPAPALPSQGTGTPAADRPGDDSARTTGVGEASATDVDRQQADVAAAALRVRVLSLADRRPVAAADVYCLRPDQDVTSMSMEDNREAGDDFDAFLRRVGLHCVCDDDGWCTVPQHPGYNTVLATHERLRGRLQLLPAATGPVEVLLRPDHTLRVLVLDADGAPAPGVDVLVQAKSGPLPDGWTMGPTDANGAIIEKHVQQCAEAATTCPMLLTARAIGATSEAVEIDAVAPPAEVVLKLPPTGTVTVHLRDAAGKPLPAPYLHDDHVLLRTSPTPPGSNTLGVMQGSAHVRLDANGDATFRLVGLGGYVSAEFGVLRNGYVAGPTRDAPHVELLLQEPEGIALCIGTALDPSGAPLARRPLSLRLDYEGRRRTVGAGCQTDEHGRFQIRLPEFEPDPGTLTLSIHAVRPDEGASVIWRTTGLVRGENDFGVRQLQSPRLLLGVRFVSSTTPIPAMFGVEFESRDGGSWQRRWDLHLQQITDAAYQLRGNVADGAGLRLVVPERIAPGVPPTEFAPGTEDLVVPLDLGGSVTALFVTDESMPPDAWYAGLLPAIPDPDSQRQVSPYPGARFGERDGDTVTWKALRPGRYRLLVLGMATHEPFVTLDAIEVPAGECTDERLAAVDLRGRLRQLQIRVTDQNGTTLRNDAVTVAVRNGSTWSKIPFAADAATIAAPGAVDLAIFGPHFLTAFVDGVTTSRTIALSPATTVRASLDCPLPLPTGVALRLRALPASAPDGGQLVQGPGNSMSLSGSLTDGVIVTSGGPCEFEVRQPGLHHLWADVTLGRYSYRVRLQGTTTMALPTAGVLEVKLDAASLRTALERLQEHR